MGIYNYLKFAGVRLLLLFVFCINTFELLEIITSVLLC